MTLGALMGAFLISGITQAHPMPKDTRKAELYFAHRCGERTIEQVKACIHRAALHWGADYNAGLYIANRESRFNPNICNTQGSGACGLFQFMPRTWAYTPYGHLSVFDAKWAALGWAWLYGHKRQPYHWACC